MAALILIGFAITLIGWGIIQVLPAPSVNDAWYAFIPIILYFGGIGVSLGSAIVLAWKVFP